MSERIEFETEQLEKEFKRIVDLKPDVRVIAARDYYDRVNVVKHGDVYMVSNK